MSRDRIRPPNPVLHWLSFCAWGAIGLTVLVIAILHMQAGFAVDRAFPVPTYMIMNVPLPQRAYVQAANAIQNADPMDGEAVIATAEASAHAGVTYSQIIPRIQLGLQKAPASARGWILLAEEYFAEGNKREAARAISTALLLSPFDYWIAGRRARVSAALFDYLDSDTRALAERQAELLWETPALRHEISALLRTPGGSRLMAVAIGTDPRTTRAVNRWLADEHRKEEGVTP